jgi:hypothetical protein
VKQRSRPRIHAHDDLMPDKKHSDTPVDSCRNPTVAILLGLAALGALGACSPTFDWRSVPLPDTQLVAELPCRPARFQRDVTVAGVPLKLFMLSCEAGGVTYGVATAEVSDPARVDTVLYGLRDSAAAAIRSADSLSGALKLDGITPFSGNTSAHLHGRRPGGESIEEAVRVFARGTRVYQASAVGSTLPEAALRPFEEGLRFDLEKPVAGPS